MTYHPKKDYIESLVVDIEHHIANNPDVIGLTLAHLHNRVSHHPTRDEWEQALHRLNLKGRVGQAIHGKTYCCGACRADRWMVIRD